MFLTNINKIFQVTIKIMILGSLISCGSTISYQPKINDPLVINKKNNDQISLLSYNIQAIFGKDESKLDALVNYINKEKYDFVVLQELFDEDVREYIQTNLDPHVYKNIVSRIDYSSFPELLFQDAGLFMISKFPQVDLSGIRFDDEVSVSDGAVHMILKKELSISTDFLANKSVAGGLYKISNSNYLFLFTTHVQAIGSRQQKRHQYEQIGNFIEYAVHAVVNSGTVASAENILVILAGDFNSDAYNEKDLNRLLSGLGSPRELHMEKNGDKEEYSMIFKLFNFYKRFDYIFTYDHIGAYKLKRLEAKSINATDIQNSDKESLSDHLALKADLFFGQTTERSLELSQGKRSAK